MVGGDLKLMQPPILSIVGRSDSGKTTLLEKLLPELKKRGYRVGTIKHDAHNFEMDKPGKDTWKHRQAGSDVVMISSASKVAIIEKVERELSLEELAAKADGVDLILTEGYKRQKQPKIEVVRGKNPPLTRKEEGLIALMGNCRDDIEEDTAARFAEQGVPCFNWDQVSEMADLIEKFIEKKALGGEEDVT